MHAVLELVVNQLAGEVNGLDAETTQLHPKGLPYKWSAQQVVEHLALGYRLNTVALETRLAKGRLSRKYSRTWLQYSLQLMVLSFGALPSGVPALDEVTPLPGRFAPMNGQELTALLRREVDAMDLALDSCRRKFGMERVAVHPFLGPLRVDQWRRFHVVHAAHHVLQLRSIVAQVAPARVPFKIAEPSLVEQLQVPAHRSLT